MTKKEKLLSLRKKLALLSLVGTLGLTGCSKEVEQGESKIITNISGGEEVKNQFYNFDNITYKDLKDGEYLYNYLIDLSDLNYKEISNLYPDVYHMESKYGPSKAVFARLISEEYFDDDDLFNSNYNLRQNIEEEILLPDELKPLNGMKIDSLREVEAKKFLTLDGKTIYSLNYKRTFIGSIEKDGVAINPGDTIELEVVFQCVKDKYNGVINIPLKIKQSGIGSNSKNILDNSINGEINMIVPIENTVFKDMNGNYTKDYLYEALDTYVGDDSIDMPETRDIDFSAYEKKLNK